MFCLLAAQGTLQTQFLHNQLQTRSGGSDTQHEYQRGHLESTFDENSKAASGKMAAGVEEVAAGVALCADRMAGAR